MIFLKKFLIYIFILVVYDLITKNQKNVDDFTIEINNVGDNIYKDMQEERNKKLKIHIV